MGIGRTHGYILSLFVFPSGYRTYQGYITRGVIYEK
jgi:hypothetical protein